MKKIVLFSMAAAIIAGAATLVTAPAPASARPSCGDRADWLYPYDKRARKAYKRACKDRREAWEDNRKAWKKARKRRIWLDY